MLCANPQSPRAPWTHRPPPSPGRGWWSRAQAYPREWPRTGAGACLKPLPRQLKTPNLFPQSPSLPSPAPSPRPGEARRPPRGRRWALRPGWGSPGLPGMPGELSPSWSGEPPAPTEVPEGLGCAAPEQTAGCSQAGARDPSASPGARSHALALPRKAAALPGPEGVPLLPPPLHWPLWCWEQGQGRARSGGHVTLPSQAHCPAWGRVPSQPHGPHASHLPHVGKASGPSSGHQI